MKPKVQSVEIVWHKKAFFLSLLLCFFLPLTIGSAQEDLGWGEQDFTIRLKRAAFDPLQMEPQTPGSLSYRPEEAAAAGTYIVQFEGPVQDAWKAAAAAAGAVLGDYLPNYAYAVHIDPAHVESVRDLPFIRWVGAYEPAYKIAADVDLSGQRSYRISLAAWANEDETKKQLEQLDPGVVVSDYLAVVELDGAAVQMAARMAEVLWIEPVYLQKIFNDVAGGTIMNGGTAWSNGYTGTGIGVAVADTGLDKGSTSDIHLDFAGRVGQITSWPVQSLNFGDGCITTNAGANDGAGDTNSGHGTHVAGSAAGNGARSSGNFKGLAYTSNIYFQAVEQYTTFSDDCGAPPGYYLTGIPGDVRLLLNEVYNWGARIQNDSWGGGVPGAYDTQASLFDDFIFNHSDFTVVVAAGNAGIDADRDGYVDQNSVSSPAAAKNVITVGASDNFRLSGGVSTRTWSSLWPTLFPVPPTGSDYTSDNIQELAAFSSRGPMADGRIRPDVVAPGTNIISARSSLASLPGWGIYDTYYMYMGGTSMASPLVAGAAGLVRQYYISTEEVANPSAALIKATLINTATDISGYGNRAYEAGQPIPNQHEGWGLVNVGKATTPGRGFLDNNSGISTGTTHTYPYYLEAGHPFKVTLVWSDYPGSPIAIPALFNNLNLKVTAPDGTTTYWGNRFSGGWSISGGSPDTVNNVENVYIQSASGGIWQVQVVGQNIPHGPQAYALVVDGEFQAPMAFDKIAPEEDAIGQTANPIISWNISPNADSYEYCTDISEDYTCNSGVWINVGTALTTTLPQLAPSTPYSWQVRAVNAGGTTEANTGAWWNFITAAFPAGFDKSDPVNGAPGQTTTLTLSWDESEGATGYQYCYDTSLDSACEDDNWIDTQSATSASLTGLTPGVTYTWQVRALNDAGSIDADQGSWWTFSVLPLPGSFSKLSPPNVARSISTTPLLAWGTSSNATRYEICYDQTNDNLCEANAWTNTGTATSANLLNLNAGMVYYWQVRAINASGSTDGDSGSWWSFTTGWRTFLPVVLNSK